MIDNAFDPKDYEYIMEEASLDSKSPRSWYIKGPYMMAESANKNKRIYSLDEMIAEATRYTNEMIKPGRAMGELNHPATADVDLERACHLVQELKQEKNIFHGKSKVLSTPTGLIVRSLINDGVKIGMSTRGLGQLIGESGLSRVKGFRLVAIDCVADPSASCAFVNGLLESKQYVLNQDGSYEEIYEDLDIALKSMPRKNRDEYLRKNILAFINNL